MIEACWVCHDVRAVYASHPKWRRAVTCPVCGQFHEPKESDKEKFHYGNPFLLNEDDYRVWRLRAESRVGWPRLTQDNLKTKNRDLFDTLRATWPRADVRWVLAWVEGQCGSIPKGIAPTIQFETDLTDAEFELFKWEREEFGISKEEGFLRAEGRRYDPAKDAEFMAVIPARLEAWRATRKGPE